MKRMIFVSNRLPKKVRKRKDRYIYQDSPGGLATGLNSLSGGMEVKWIGWPGVESDALKKGEIEEISADFEKEDLIPVFLTRKEINDFYHGFCNRTIWPLFHYFTQFSKYHREQWEAYERINRRFLKAVLDVYEPGDLIWVHDYHLMLLPGMIRKKIEDAQVGFFLHIPFPSYEVFRLFPKRKELLDGLLGADLVGFHTYDYVTHFLNSVRRIRGFEHDLGVVSLGERLCRVDAYPMGIDYERFEDGAREKRVVRFVDKIREKVGDRRIILSIDRLDYSKGILDRLDSYDRFLGENPSWMENVTLILVAVPSRERVDHYENLKRQLDEKIGYIEGRYGRIGWTPVWYIYRFLPFYQLLALYSAADVCLVTPLRDGMNLMAKEFLATKSDGRGVLILSEMAGAAHELGESLIVNPYDHSSTADTIGKALDMKPEEQVTRNRAMQKRLRRYDIQKWGMDFFSDLSNAEQRHGSLYSRRLLSEDRAEIIDSFRRSRNRLVVLDYDGTLAEFVDRPEEARPDEELIEIVRRLSSDMGAEVVLISGRDRDTLEEWFRTLGIRVCAEHGAWFRDGKGSWIPTAHLDTGWKGPIRNLMETYTDRTPGSFLEEKGSSLVWHYRRTNPELGSIRSRELIGDLLDLTANTGLGILEGNKVIEVRDRGINKGSVLNRLLEEKEWDFMLAMGDDVTDEDMFQALPEEGYSIKVGPHPTKARYNLGSVGEVRALLKEFLER